MSVLRKSMIAVLAAASIAVGVPDAASARGGGGGGGGHGGGGFGGGHGGFGGGFHGGGFGGGYHGGGYHGGGYHRGFGPGFGVGAALGLGFYAPYYYGYPDYYYPDAGYEEEYPGGCYLVRRHVHTRYGWRFQTVQICQ